MALGKEQEKIDQIIVKWNEVYFQWKQGSKDRIKRIREIISIAEFPEDSVVAGPYKEPKPTLNDDIFNEVFVKITEYESLNQSQIEKNTRLEVLEFKRKHISDDKEKIEKQLMKLSTNWSNYPIPHENQSILESKIDLFEIELEEINSNSQYQNNILNQLKISRRSQNDMLIDIKNEIVEKKKKMSILGMI
ncbi:hypothetical protein [Lysinibacillus xylanilyticus]|uniref:hypothetical protein n=1 Tax=Lysinibacillus xylanilyticus TaxID=582475 RepID=UPI0038039BEE